MLYKPDWAETKQRYSAWWRGEKLERCQCDASYGISPETFREVYVPALKKTLAHLDYTVYHVDGVGAFPHVEELCKIEKIQAIQILPGAGKPSPLHYLDVLRLVQESGKNLHISIPPEEVPQALELLSARGLCLCTHARTEKQAREISAQAQRLSRNRLALAVGEWELQTCTLKNREGGRPFLSREGVGG